MAIYKNITQHSISLMIQGSKKIVNPGQIVHGNESLLSIPGLILIEADRKAIIPSNQQRTTSPIQFQVDKQPQNYNPYTTTNIQDTIKNEIDYLLEFKTKNNNPTISLAILTKNAYNLITNCCESIFEKVQYPNITLTIIDTGTDQSNVRDYYKTLNSKCLSKGWNYQFIQLQYFYYGKNYNDAISQITTDYVLIQNNDTVALNDYVSEMIYTACLNKVGSTGCRMLYPDKRSIQHDGQTIYNAQNGIFGSPGHINLKRDKNDIPQSYTDLVDGNTAAGVLMRVSDYKKINGFDERYKDIFQDVDLMMKIPPILHKFNYCNKIANIIHIDNASRLNELPNPKRQQSMVDDSRFIVKRANENGWVKAVKPKDVDFSIITLVYNYDDYLDFCKSIELQSGNHTIEIIGIPNFFNLFTSAYKAYNSATDIASGKYLIYCHDDIVVGQDWLDSIKKSIINIESNGISWGVLGPAGVINESNQGAYFLKDEKNNNITGENIVNTNKFYQVDSLDELCLITKKSNKLRFSDTELSGFHFYGANLCYLAKIKGLKSIAIPCWTYHKSDGYKNLNSHEKYSVYEESAKSFDLWAKRNNIYQWRTTTAMSNNGKITLFPERKY